MTMTLTPKQSELMHQLSEYVGNGKELIVSKENTIESLLEKLSKFVEQPQTLEDAYGYFGRWKPNSAGWYKIFKDEPRLMVAKILDLDEALHLHHIEDDAHVTQYWYRVTDKGQTYLDLLHI